MVVTKIIAENTQIREFFGLHAATPNFAGGARQIYTMQGEPQLVTWFRQQPSEIAAAVERLYFYGDSAYYTTKNSFFADKRQSKYLFSLDNIVIDVDCHDRELSDREYKYYSDQLCYVLGEDNGGRIPEFNVCRSGRGLHLWTALQSASAKIQPYYSLYGGMIADRVQAVCKEIGSPFTVDTAATVNAAGLVRLPWTINQAVGRIAEFEKYTDRRYSFEELQELCALNINGSSGKLFEKSHGRRCKETDRAAYLPLNRKRLNFLESIISNDNEQTGRRDLLLFAYINAAFQLSGSAEFALSQGVKFNSQYSEPLSIGEIRTIHKYIVDRGGLDFTVKRFFEFVQATVTEMSLYNSTISDREAQRAANRQKKAERNAKILFLHSQGLSCRQIAAECGCSKDSVSRLIQRQLII